MIFDMICNFPSVNQLNLILISSAYEAFQSFFLEFKMQLFDAINRNLKLIREKNVSRK